MFLPANMHMVLESGWPGKSWGPKNSNRPCYNIFLIHTAAVFFFIRFYSSEDGVRGVFVAKDLGLGGVFIARRCDLFK